jgi:hypothetical protein
MRIVSRMLLLSVALSASACGGHGGSASRTHAPFEAVAYHLRCPPTDARHEASPDPMTAGVLVPTHPTGALICRYWGFHDSGRKASFAGARSVTDTTALNRAAAVLDKLPPLYEGSPATSCPELGGRSELIFFHYRRASDDQVRVLKVCRVPVSNGRLAKEAIGIGPTEAQWPDEGLL